MRSRGKQPHVWIARAKQHSIAQRHGFPNKEDDTSQRSPAWKPYLYKGKSKLTLHLAKVIQQIQHVNVVLEPESFWDMARKRCVRSVVETINCTLYGKSEYHDEAGRTHAVLVGTTSH